MQKRIAGFSEHKNTYTWAFDGSGSGSGSGAGGVEKEVDRRQAPLALPVSSEAYMETLAVQLRDTIYAVVTASK